MEKMTVVLASFAVLAASFAGELNEVRSGSQLVGLSLFDGKVLVNGNISGSAKYTRQVDFPESDRAARADRLRLWIPQGNKGEDVQPDGRHNRRRGRRA